MVKVESGRLSLSPSTLELVPNAEEKLKTLLASNVRPNSGATYSKLASGNLESNSIIKRAKTRLGMGTVGL
jgi:hypothetical protein